MLKKILLINKSLVIGGIETVLVTQYKKLKENHNVDILLFKNIIDIKIDNKKDIFFINNYSSISNFIKKQEEHNKYDLIICHAQSENICKKVKSLNKKNTIFVIHGMHSKKLLNGNIVARYLRKKRMQSLYKNQNLVSVSNAVKDDIDSINIKYKNIKTIYNPFDIDTIQKLSKENFKQFSKNYIVWVGRIEDIKNLPLLIEIYKHISNHYDLVIVGDGSKDIILEIKKRIKELKIEKNVHFIGFCNNPYPYILNASAMIITSKSEGFGLVILESLLLNTPVFGVNISVFKELLNKYFKYGLFTSTDSYKNSQQIINNIDKTIDTHKIYNDLSYKISNKKYLEYFN